MLKHRQNHLDYDLSCVRRLLISNEERWPKPLKPKKCNISPRFHLPDTITSVLEEIVRGDAVYWVASFLRLNCVLLL